MSHNSSYITRKNIFKDPLWKNSGPLLSKLDIELTERCNNNCIHCYINLPKGDKQTQKREMPTDRVKGILDEAASLGCMTIRFTGGEPLLRPDFEELYLDTRKKGMSVILFTNATLVSEKLCRLLQKYPPGKPVEITLYGMTRESYEEISRVQGSYEAAIRGIELLKKHAIQMTLKGIFLRGREAELEAFKEFAKKYSAEDQHGGISMDFNLRARRDSSRKNARIATLRATPQETLDIVTRNNTEEYIRDKKQFAGRFMRPGGPDLFTCGCGKGGSVDAYGRLQPCLLLRHPDVIYDLENGTLKDAITNFFPKVLDRKAEDADYLNKCARCFLKGLCNQCPAWSWMESGTLDIPVEYLCEVAHKQAEFLGLVKPGESAWEVEEWQQRIDDFTSDNTE